ncbi:MAG: hypothetical protein K0S56_909 [Microvirga sp.]|jgi:hypothetical protein|nr:hypothetical protein [Microvirga sp.]
MRLRTPAEVAVELHCSERHLRKLARDLRACSVVGKVMLLSDADVQTILDASRPAPRLGRASPPTFHGVSEGDYETLRTRVEKAVSKRRTA